MVPLRSYPLASAAAHALGRVGEITERQLQLAGVQGPRRRAPSWARPGSSRSYNRELMGQDGFRRVIVNSRGLEVAGGRARAPGGRARASPSRIDAALQAAMEQAFEGRAGAAVALDPETGEILAMTSTPAYDPNEFTTGIDAGAVGEPRDATRDTPLMNRVIQGAYAPGSTFKRDRRDGRARGGRHHARDHLLLPGPPHRLQHRLPLPQAGRATASSTCSGAIAQLLQRLLLQRRHPARDRAHREVGEADGARRADRRRPAPRGAAGSCRARSGSMRVLQGALVRGRDGLGGDRPGPGERDAAADGARRRGRRERRPPACGRTSSRQAARRSAEPAVDLGIKPETIAAVQGGHARGGGRGHRLARAAAGRSRSCGKTGSAQVVAKARLEKSPTRRRDAAPRLVHRPSPPPTARRSPSRCWSSTAGAAASRRRRWPARSSPTTSASTRRRADAGRRRRRHRGGGLRLAIGGIDRRLRLQRRLGARSARRSLLALRRRRDDLLRHPVRAATPDLYLKQLDARRRSGLVALVVAAAIDYRRLADRAVLLYVLSVAGARLRAALRAA